MSRSHPTPGRRRGARRLGLGLVAAWELLPAGVALAAAAYLGWIGASRTVWGFCLLVSLGLAVIGWLRLRWWLGPR